MSSMWSLPCAVVRSRWTTPTGVGAVEIDCPAAEEPLAGIHPLAGVSAGIGNSTDAAGQVVLRLPRQRATQHRRFVALVATWARLPSASPTFAPVADHDALLTVRDGRHCERE